MLVHMSDLDQLEADLLAAALKTFKGGIGQYQVGDRIIQYRTPKELLEAIALLKALRSPTAGGQSSQNVAEVID
jgi:hypothetical protein